MLIRNSDTPCISFRARCLLFDSPFPPAAEISALSKARITTVAEPKSLRTLLLSASREFIGAVRTCGRACTRVCSQTCTRTRIQASRARFRSHRYSCLTASTVRERCRPCLRARLHFDIVRVASPEWPPPIPNAPPFNILDHDPDLGNESNKETPSLLELQLSP